VGTNGELIEASAVLVGLRAALAGPLRELLDSVPFPRYRVRRVRDARLWVPKTRLHRESACRVSSAPDR
jgi:hypothetical protein